MQLLSLALLVLFLASPLPSTSSLLPRSPLSLSFSPPHGSTISSYSSTISIHFPFPVALSASASASAASSAFFSYHAFLFPLDTPDPLPAATPLNRSTLLSSNDHLLTITDVTLPSSASTSPAAVAVHVSAGALQIRGDAVADLRRWGLLDEAQALLDKPIEWEFIARHQNGLPLHFVLPDGQVDLSGDAKTTGSGGVAVDLLAEGTVDVVAYDEGQQVFQWYRSSGGDKPTFARTDACCTERATFTTGRVLPGVEQQIVYVEGWTWKDDRPRVGVLAYSRDKGYFDHFKSPTLIAPRGEVTQGVGVAVIEGGYVVAAYNDMVLLYHVPPDALNATSAAVTLWTRSNRSVAFTRFDTGDVNGDGFLDICVLRTLSRVGDWPSSVLCLLSTGPAAFASSATMVIEDGPVGDVAFHIVDMDMDGMADIVFDAHAGAVHIFYGGTFQAHVERQVQDIDVDTPVTIADVDGDGFPDIVLPYETSVLMLLSTNGGTTFIMRPLIVSELPYVVRGIAVADMNGDGLADLLLDLGDIAFWVTQSRQNFMEMERITGTSHPKITCADYGMPLQIIQFDVDADGHEDEVVVSSCAAAVFWRKGYGLGRFAADYSLIFEGDPGGFFNVSVRAAVGRLASMPNQTALLLPVPTLDKLILLTDLPRSTHVVVAEGDTVASVTSCLLVDLHDAPQSALCYSSLGNGWLGYFANVGTAFQGDFVSLTQSSGGVKDVVVADLSAAGRLDIVVVEVPFVYPVAVTTVNVYTARSHYVASVYVDDSSHSVHLAAADVNADGRMDLIVSEYGPCCAFDQLLSTRWHSMGDSTSDGFSSHTVTSGALMSPTLVDLDANGYVDIVGYAPDQKLTVLYNQGGVFGARYVLSGSNGHASRFALERIVVFEPTPSVFDMYHVHDGALRRVRFYPPNAFVHVVDIPAGVSDVARRVAALDPARIGPGAKIIVRFHGEQHVLDAPVSIVAFRKRMVIVETPSTGVGLHCRGANVRSSTSACLHIVAGDGPGLRVLGGSLFLSGTHEMQHSGPLLRLHRVNDNYMQSRITGLWPTPGSGRDVYDAMTLYDVSYVPALAVSMFISRRADVPCVHLTDSESLLLDSFSVTACDTVAAGIVVAERVDVLRLSNAEFNTGEGVSGGLSVSDSSLVLISGGSFSFLTGSGAGGAVSAVNVDDIRISQTIFEGCTSVTCGAVSAVKSALSLNDVTLTRNRAATHGGAVCVELGSLQMLGVKMTNNDAIGRGGALLLSASSVSVTTTDAWPWQPTDTSVSSDRQPKVLFEQNSALGSGGAVSAINSHGNFDSVLFLSNEVPRGEASRSSGAGEGGAMWLSGSTMSVTSSRFEKNHAGTRGGAFTCRTDFVSEAVANISDSVFVDNEASLGDGGAVHLDDCLARVSATEFSGNRASRGSGGVLAVHVSERGSSVSLSKVSMVQNWAKDNGGAVVLYCERQQDFNAVNYVTLDRCTVQNNTAEMGGGGMVYWVPYAPDDNHFPVAIDSSSVLGPNSASYGNQVASRAVRIEPVDVSASVLMQTSRVNFRGGLVFRLVDYHWNTATSVESQSARLVPERADATVMGSGIETSAVGGVLNFTAAEDLQLEGRPGQRYKLRLKSQFDWEVVEPREIEIGLRDCQPGESVEDGLRCVDCGPGRFTETINAPECELCPLGRFGDVERASTCSECEAGFFTSTRGSRSCIPCSLGTYLTKADAASARSCKPCPPNTYASTAQSAECRECVPPRFANHGSSVECGSCASAEYPRCVILDPSVKVCPPDQWGPLLREGKITIKCVPCPDHAACQTSADDSVVAANVSFRDIVHAEDGTWIDFDRVGVASTFACRGRSCVDNGCAPGRASADDNPLCARCAEHYYHWGGKCVECEDDAVRWDIVVPMVMGTFVLVCGYHLLVQGAKSELPIVIYFMQMAALFTASTSFRTHVLEVVNTSIFDTTGSVCLGPVDPIQAALLGLASAMTVYASWVVLVGCAAAWRVVLHSAEKTWKEWMRPYWRTLLSLFLLTFNVVVGTGLAFLHCVEVKRQGETVSVVQAFPDVECSSEGYRRGLPWVVLLVVFELVVLPSVFLWRVMVGLRKHAEHGEEDARGFVSVWGVLFTSFRPRRFYWEFWNLGRRVALLVLSVFLDNNRPQRLSSWSLMNVAVLFGHMTGKPFRSRAANVAEGFSLAMLCVITLALPMMGDELSRGDERILGALVFVPACCLVVWVLRRASIRWRSKLTARDSEEVVLGGSQMDVMGVPLLGSGSFD